MFMKFFQVLCYFDHTINKINVFKVIPSSNLSFFSIYKVGKEHHIWHVNYHNKLIMPTACTQAKIIWRPLSLCSSAFPYLFSFFFSPFVGMFTFQSHYLGITNKPYLLFFIFSPTSRLFIQHVSKFCYFFLFLPLKAVISFLFLKPKTSS